MTEISISTAGYSTISTHTLTWSVTSFVIVLLVIVIISTHTLTWSVTRNASAIEDIKTISTHTLTWSVTVFTHFRGSPNRFQLTRSRGA